MINRLKKCALCGVESELELSHIVPKMAVRTLKKTSIGNIRNTDNPNMTVQDSEKHYMLCGECEDLFSEYETYFANLMFHPYLKSEKIKFDYDERLFYFLTSVSWRSLYWDLLDFVENHVVGIEALECLIKAEKIMHDYLLHKRADIEHIENHIYFFDDIKEISNNDPNNIKNMHPHASFHRGIASYTFCYEKEGTYGTITNMMGIVILTFYGLGKEEKWVNTKILNQIGIIKAREQMVTSVVGNEFAHITKTTYNASNNMSDSQQKKVADRISKAGETVKDSAVFKDWENDRRLAEE